MATTEQLSSFLAEVERRAFRQAMYAVQNEESALDLVQDAMLKLAERYGDRPSEELPLLFQRILQNAIRDYYRRSKVRSTWTTLFSALSSGNEDDEDADILETLDIEPQTEDHQSPDQQLDRAQTLALIEEALQQLPARQREAFLMRYLEEMDVAETAAAMGCSEGSVKTHCSRAVHSLAAWLKEKGVAPQGNGHE
ncbi:MAG: RNA polymerase sigma factor [Burkholderiales bacterium]|nr:RNA polymerase sigma factor [Burkholderiales bacterium]